MELNIFAALSSYKDGSGVMCDGNEARAHLQEKLEQARRLLQQVSDPTTTEGLKGLIADLENRLRNLLDPK
jgi:exonuclease VII small subunit